MRSNIHDYNLNSYSSSRTPSSGLACLSPLEARPAFGTACQFSPPSCLNQTAKLELAICCRSGIFTVDPHVDFVRVEAELKLRKLRQSETSEQRTIPMIMADSKIGFLYHQTTSLYSLPLTTAL
jgi:hypothetical protein